MRLGLNGSTIMHTDLITELKITDEAGFEIAELRDAKLRPYLKRHSMNELLAFMKTLKVKPVNINALEPVTFVSEKDWPELLERAEWFSSNAAQLGCATIAVVPGIAPASATKQDCFDEAVKALKRIAPIAENYGVGMSFEFIGFKGFSTRSIAECMRIIETVDKPYIGMVFDFIHFHAGDTSLKELAAVDGRSIHMVHLDDARDLPLEAHQESDGKRLLPGDGIIDTDAIMETLVKIGYDGDYSIEIYNEDIWNMDPVQVAHDAYAKGRKVLSKYYR